MKREPKIFIGVLTFILLLIHNHCLIAEPSRNMRFLIDNKVSVMECLCYQLEQNLYDMYQREHPQIADALCAIAEQTNNRELMRSNENWEKRLLSQFEAKAFFDYTSNRLTINVASHGAPGSLQTFKQYWEEERLTDFASGKLTKLPQYKILRLFLVRKIGEFPFQKECASTNYKEDIIKKELIERLKINIFFSSMFPGYLFREYSDGLWKRIELSFS
jgi:hypothetical protein